VKTLDFAGKVVPFDLPWPKGTGPGLFLGRLHLDGRVFGHFGIAGEGCYLAVFGVKRPEHGRPGSWRAEYAVVEERGDGGRRLHRLGQFHQSVMFMAEADRDERQQVDMLKKTDMPCAGRRPRWKASEAAWPFRDGMPFLFLGQLYVPETPTTRERFAWDETAYVFAFAGAGDELAVQIFLQDTSAQTAEEHYRLEEMMAEFEQHADNGETVRRLLKRGDRHFYDFLFEHPLLDQRLLEMIARDGATKSVRDRAGKELRRRPAGAK
jgi:hypothetical protein